MPDHERESPPLAERLARLEALEADFQRTLESEKLEAMAEFAAGAGHEINNPLTVISGRAQLLLREETDPERRHALALISVQAMRVHEMIADMMLFARPPRPELQPVDVVKLVGEMIVELAPAAARQETTIRRLGQQPGPILVEADPVQLGVALRAICRNSLEALQSGGNVEIEVQGPGNRSQKTLVSGQWPVASGQCEIAADKFQIPHPKSTNEVRILVHDDGPGIKPEERRHLFDPFYSARQAGRGLGLGLSKAWRIIANHGGRIEIESQTGHGATFTVKLAPLAESDL